MNMKINIKRKNWQLTKLGDILTKIEDNDKENAKNKYQKFLKVEHLDAESLHIKRWGDHTKEELPPTFFKIFKQGQILFPTRNPHLKRTAYAHFDGICGEKTLTLEPIESMVIPKFIPFLFHSKKFYDHSTSAIIGSTNPHVRWRDIAEFEFLLPPKEDQTKLAKLLWAADNVIEKDKELLEKLEVVRNTNRENLFSIGLNFLNGKKVSLKQSFYGKVNRNWDEVKFSEVVEISSGQVDPSDPKYSNLIQIGSERIEANTGRITEKKTAKELNITSGNYLFSEEHLIYSKIRPYFKKVANPDFAGLCSADIYPIKPKTDKLNKEFLFYFLLTDRFTNTLLKFQNRTGMPKVNREELNSMHIPLPSYNEQLEIVKVFKDIDKSLFDCESKLQSSQALLKSLINEVFG